MNNRNRNRRRPKSRIDSENVKIIRCKYCKQPITFSYGSVGRDGKAFPCNLDGTRHIEKGGRN
jgi:hypothetical protein